MVVTFSVYVYLVRKNSIHSMKRGPKCPLNWCVLMTPLEGDSAPESS